MSRFDDSLLCFSQVLLGEYVVQMENPPQQTVFIPPAFCTINAADCSQLGIQFAHTVPCTELTLLRRSIFDNISPSDT